MPELTENQIADLRALQDHCRSLGADLVIIGAIAYQVHFPREDRHPGDIDFAVALDLEKSSAEAAGSSPVVPVPGFSRLSRNTAKRNSRTLKIIGRLADE